MNLFIGISLFLVLVTTNAQDQGCKFNSPLGTFDFSPHIEFGTMGPVQDSLSGLDTYLSICHDGTQACNAGLEMAAKFSGTFCIGVLGRFSDPTFELVDPSDSSKGIRQSFENGDMCFGEIEVEPSKTTIEFICDRNATGDTYTTTSSNFNCDFLFTVPTPFACIPEQPDDCGNCVHPRIEAGCDSEEVEECVCKGIGAMSCCTSEWHPACAELAHTSCGCVEPIDCCNCNIDHGFPGCCNAEVERCVCSFAPYCCQTAWDLPCSEIAQTQCGCSAPYFFDNKYLGE